MNSDGGMDYSREATGSCRAAAFYYDREVRATGALWGDAEGAPSVRAGRPAALAGCLRAGQPGARFALCAFGAGVQHKAPRRGDAASAAVLVPEELGGSGRSSGGPAAGAAPRRCLCVIRAALTAVRPLWLRGEVGGGVGER